MGMGAEGDNLHGGPAKPLLTLLPIHAAMPGTEVTILKEGVGLLNPLGQLPLFLQFLISWDPLFFFLGYG
jgi:hypothetical protein